MSNFQPTRIAGVVNDTVSMAKDFMDGKPFTVDLSLKVISTFDLENKADESFPILNTAGVNYMKLLQRLGYKKIPGDKVGNIYLSLMNHAKQRMIDNQPVLLGNDIFFIQLGQTTKLEIALMVRYINICHKAQHLVVINDEIVYVPDHYRHRDHEELGRHVKLSLLKHNDKTKNKLVKSTKTGTRYLRAQMLKTVVKA